MFFTYTEEELNKIIYDNRKHLVEILEEYIYKVVDMYETTLIELDELTLKEIDEEYLKSQKNKVMKDMLIRINVSPNKTISIYTLSAFEYKFQYIAMSFKKQCNAIQKITPNAKFEITRNDLLMMAEDVIRLFILHLM